MKFLRNFTFRHFEFFAPKLEDILYQKVWKWFNFRAKIPDFDLQLNLQKLWKGGKSQFWQTLHLHIWIFAPKLEDILEYFIQKSIKIIEFSCQKSIFWPKIELKTLEKSQFQGSKMRNSFIFWHFKFKIFCQIGFKII